MSLYVSLCLRVSVEEAMVVGTLVVFGDEREREREHMREKERTREAYISEI
jgi:hypothetical protein